MKRVQKPLNFNVTDGSYATALLSLSAGRYRLTLTNSIFSGDGVLVAQITESDGIQAPTKTLSPTDTNSDIEFSCADAVLYLNATASGSDVAIGEVYLTKLSP